MKISANKLIGNEIVLRHLYIYIGYGIVDFVHTIHRTITLVALSLLCYTYIIIYYYILYYIIYIYIICMVYSLFLSLYNIFIIFYEFTIVYVIKMLFMKKQKEVISISHEARSTIRDWECHPLQEA